MSDEPTSSSGKKVDFSKQQYNFWLHTRENEMYSLGEYLGSRLRVYESEFSNMYFTSMVNLSFRNLESRGIPIEDCKLLMRCFKDLDTTTTFLSNIYFEIGLDMNMEKHLQELHRVLTDPTFTCYVGYNQMQLMENLRGIFNYLKVSSDGKLSKAQKNFVEICMVCEANTTFAPDYRSQLLHWANIIKGKPFHLPAPKNEVAIPGKSILKKPQDQPSPPEDG